MRGAAKRGDLAAYADCLADRVDYIRVDGSSGDRDALIREAGSQFRRLAAFDAVTIRIEGSFDGTVVRETLTQTSSAATVAFLVVRRRWRMERVLAFEWVHEHGAWRVRRVAMTLLSATPAGWGWGRAR